jgi:hypothetical protein
MIRWILSLCVIPLSLSLSGQILPLPYDTLVDLDPHWGNSLRLSTGADYNANTVYNELPWNIVLGGYLERDIRTRSLDELTTDRNTAGQVLEGRLTWVGAACLKKLPGWRPTISVAHHDMRGARFTKDEFALAFFGNAAYENKEAVLAPSGFQAFNYQSLGAGLHHGESGSFVRLDLIRGLNHLDLEVENADLFTSTDGRELQMAFGGAYHASDTAGTGFGRINGVGGALNGLWKGRFRVGSRPIEFGIGVEDFGFVRWNDHSVSIDRDTAFAFAGWQVQNIFALDDVVITDSLILDTLGLRYKTGSNTTLLPFRAALEFSTKLGRKGQLSFGLDQRNIVGYVPQVSLLGSRRFGSSTQLGVSASYGGFGVLRVGVAAKQRVGEQLLFNISTPNVAGFFMGNTRGVGAFFGMEVTF